LGRDAHGVRSGDAASFTDDVERDRRGMETVRIGKKPGAKPKVVEVKPMAKEVAVT
jgi:hypothetical protein